MPDDMGRADGIENPFADYSEAKLLRSSTATS